MPYIEPKLRNKIHEIDGLDKLLAAHYAPGEITYIITRLIRKYLDAHVSFEGYATVIGILEACKLEFYRRRVVPYEDFKRDVNGDV